ncbi:hypothetical protein [Streptomyces sp. NPDC057690]
MAGVQERDRAVQVEVAVHGSGKSVRVRRVLEERGVDQALTVPSASRT